MTMMMMMKLDDILACSHIRPVVVAPNIMYIAGC